MPWLDDAEIKNTGGNKFYAAFRNALTRRIPAAQLARAFRQVQSRYPTSPKEIAQTLLGFRARKCGNDDPLLFDYASLLLRLGLINTESLLLGVLDTSRFAKWNTQADLDGPSSGLPTCEERMFNALMQQYPKGDSTIDSSDLHNLAYAFVRWLRATTEFEVKKQLQDGAPHTLDVHMFHLYETLASLAITVLGDPLFRKVAQKPWWRKRRMMVVQEMRNFDDSVLQWMQSQLAGRLHALSTLPPFLPTDEKGLPIFTDDQVLQSIQDLQAVNSQAGLYIWLNACLYSRPSTDDAGMLMYLQTRFSGDIQTLICELLTASFDSVVNSSLRQESEHSIKVVRSFICDKLPTLLAFLASNMAHPTSVETDIQMAFSSVMMDALPPMSTGASEMRERLRVTRLEFLRACMTHGIISEGTATAIHGDLPSSPRTTKYAKESLVARLANNLASLDGLLNELDATQGNAGAIAGCVVELVRNLCASRDSISLKVFCNMLIRRVPSMDIVLQYTNPTHLLLPLCNQLNDWVHDQDQAEFTPAYEEFASILLFVLAVVHRYGLTAADLGLQSEGTFVSRLLRDMAVSYSPGDLTTEQNGQLSKWIEGLYSTDEQGETAGIGDEVMRPCPPQAFYQLVPTLFEQSVLARKSGALSVKAFRGGLELLVEPFLLPSLIPGLSWLIKHSWEDHDDADVLLQLLDKLLKPSSTVQETRAMHHAIMTIIADPLARSLQKLSQRKPGKQEVTALIETLRPFLGQGRGAMGSDAEVEQWTSTPEGGIARCLRNAIGDQTAWVTNVGPTPPPKYTHALFVTACAVLGVDAILDAIVAELRQQTKLGKGSWALDVCAAMICAPAAGSSTTLMALSAGPPPLLTAPSKVREALRLRTANAQNLLQIPVEDAECIVRLARRVEAQLLVTHMPQLDMPLALPNQAADQIMVDLGLADADMAATAQNSLIAGSNGNEFTNADIAAALEQSIDMTAAANMSSTAGVMPTDPTQDIFAEFDMEVPQSLTQVGNASGAGNQDDVNAEEDIFAGLDMDMDADFGFT